MNLAKVFDRHGYILMSCDQGQNTARRFVHCLIVRRATQERFFAKVAKTAALRRNLEREMLLSSKAKSLPKQIRLTASVDRIGKNIFIYQFIQQPRMSDHLDKTKGRLSSTMRRAFSQLAVDFNYRQNAISYRPREMFLDIKKFERELISKAKRSPIYRRTELLTYYAQLNKGKKLYRYEIGDYQLQNLVFTENPATLILFDLEAWSLFRAQWSFASLFAISWFRHYGERLSKDLYEAFINDSRTTDQEKKSFLLCVIYFVILYYPSYSRRSERYRRHFQQMIDWLCCQVGDMD